MNNNKQNYNNKTMRKHLFLVVLGALLVGMSSCKDNNEPETSSDMVDLGLSVKWASKNVGATCGNTAWSWHGSYFAWGETETKSKYDWTTYKWGTPVSWTKYGKYIDRKTLLEAADDAATAKLGGKWRMPTKTELDELRNNCTWTWVTNYQGINDLNGYVVTGKKSGYTDKSIFLPAAGLYSESTLYNVGTNGYYWTSTLYSEEEEKAYDLDFDSKAKYTIPYYDRSLGQTIRAVCQ